MTKRRTVIVPYSDCCKRTIIEEIEKKGLKKGLTPEQANKFLQEELIFNKKVEQSRYAAGDAQTYPLDDKFIFIYENSARNTDLSHEVEHTLGLEHSFDEFKNKEE